MSVALVPLIVAYHIGDEFTFSATEHKPVLAASKEAFLEEFALAMASYEPEGKADKFLCCGQLFEYRDFIEWHEKQKTKRRSEWTYDSIEPTVYSVDEWLRASLTDAKRESEAGNVMQLPGRASPANVLTFLMDEEASYVA